MQEPAISPPETRVADAPETAARFSTAMQSRLGIQSNDIHASDSLRIVQTITTSMKAATEAIQANSEIITNVLNKEQKNLFTNFLKQLRNDTVDGEDAFLKGHEKFLERLAQLQVSLTESLAQAPGDRNLPILLKALNEIKTSFIPSTAKAGLMKELKAELFTPLKGEHFKEDSFVRRAFFQGSDVYGKKLKQAQNAQKAAFAIQQIEEPLGLSYDAERDKYVDPRMSERKINGKDFRKAKFDVNDAIKGLRKELQKKKADKDGVVDADEFVPNKQILEDSIKGLLVLGKHDESSARKAALEAMKNGATSPSDVLQAIFGNGKKKEKVAEVVPEKSKHTVNATIEPSARMKFNEVYENGDSPYKEDSPYREPENALDYEPSVQKDALAKLHAKKPVAARRLGNRRGGLAGPELFRTNNAVPAEWAHEDARSIGASIAAPVIGSPVEEKPAEAQLIQPEENSTAKQLETTNETLEEISEKLDDVVAASNASSNSITNTIEKGLMGRVAQGIGNVGKGALALGATEVGAAGVGATAAVATGGLALGFGIGEGINKLTGQKTATQTIMEGRARDKEAHAKIEQSNQVIRDHGYDNFKDWHRANMQKALAKDLERANEEAQKPPTPIIVQPTPPQVIIPPPAPQPSTISPVVQGGVRPTDPVFLRFQEKRWVRTV